MSLEEQAQLRERDEVQRAVRALLARPLLTAEDEDALALVRRHADALRAFFAEQAGWLLTVERDLARLRKLPAGLDDGSRAARARAKDPPFSRRRYVLLCLALAVLERSDRQITLQRLAEGVAALLAEDEALGAAGVDFELRGRDQRRDLVAAIRWLLAHRVLRRVEGDEDAFVAERGDVLYQVDRPVLAHTLGCVRPPSSVEAEGFEARLEALVEEVQLDSDDARRRALRHGLTRRLLDDPVVYHDELSEAERDYAQRARHALMQGLADRTGLEPEVRAEGLALVDPRGDASDVALPEEGTDGHVTLLVAEHLAERGRERPGAPVPREALHAHVRELAARHRRVWRKAATEEGAEVELTARAIAHLEGLRLVRCTDAGVVPRPAIGRFALVERPPEQRELFG
jgi:uncharacterized protein (TIGR02678 family)